MIKTFKNNSEAAQSVFDLISLTESESGYEVQILQTDNGKECQSNQFILGLNKCGIALTKTVLDYGEINLAFQQINCIIMRIAQISIIVV
jgi:hypothetical protein